MTDFTHLNVIPIKQINPVELGNWIQEEIFNLTDDFGQKIEKEQAIHIGRRLKDILTTKYRNWDAGEVHSIFQMGLSGAYGKATKVTLQILLSWLSAAEKQKRGENVNNVFTYQDETITAKDKQHYEETFQRCFPFIKFCEERNIDVSGIPLEEYYQLRDYFNANGIRSTEIKMENYPRYNPSFAMHNIIRKFI